MSKLTLMDLVRHPATVAAAVTGVLGGVLEVKLFAAVFAVVWQSAGTIFTAASVAGFTLCSELDFVPACSQLQVVALLAGVVFVVKLADKVVDNFREEYE